MNRFKEMLKTEKRILIVSLPENSFDYAYAAVKNGADAVKLHVNVKHRVTGITHSAWKEIRPEALKIIGQLNVPVGIVPGDFGITTSDEMKDMAESGISFFDSYTEDIPFWTKSLKIGKMFALNHNWREKHIEALAEEGADCIEMSIVNPNDYGKRLGVDDIIAYKQILKKTDLPAFIPTQKNIQPDEVSALLSMDIKGMIIGAIVTGEDPENYGTAIKKFSDEFEKFRRCDG